MLDKILSWFIYMGVGLATTLVVIDVARTIATAPYWWNGIWAAGRKWCTPNDAAESRPPIARHWCLHVLKNHHRVNR
jgi:hypothetical protein